MDERENHNLILKNQFLQKILEQKEYAILTAEISKAAFGMTPSEYKSLKD